MIQRILSGGQTGADRAALDAALACGVTHGGWCPRGRLAEDGRIPDYYDLRETESEDALERTTRNVADAQATVIFTLGPLTGGSLQTERSAHMLHKPCLHLRLDAMSDREAADTLGEFVAEHRISSLNVAGSRASHEPELRARVFEILCRTLTSEARPRRERFDTAGR